MFQVFRSSLLKRPEWPKKVRFIIGVPAELWLTTAPDFLNRWTYDGLRVQVGSVVSVGGGLKNPANLPRTEPERL